jgi:hypothetical protein
MPTYFTDGKLNTKYDNNIKDEGEYVDIKNFRNDLDIKLRNLYNNRDGAMKNQKQQIDSTVYENILLTVLATSILYFTFIKI